MSRHYPRFLFSNPQNTKSKGPFIVHTLFPFEIYKVNLNDKYPWFKLELLHSNLSLPNDGSHIPLILKAEEWFINQPESPKFNHI